MVIGLIREGKPGGDSRVALTPAQCKWLMQNQAGVNIHVQPSEIRSYKDEEYKKVGITLTEDLSNCDILFGIKEVPVHMLIPGKTYFFFSHTIKLQPYNQNLLQTLMQNNNTLIDYECLVHDDGTRIIGFGFFAGVVGAHNGMMAYGNRTGAFKLERVYKTKSFNRLIHTYFGLKLPDIKIAVTGSGRVAHGVVEVMNLMGIHEVEPDEFSMKQFAYPVYTQLKGADLYQRKDGGGYKRQHFHDHPGQYDCVFKPYLQQTDILINGVYWEDDIPRLFEMEDMRQQNFRLRTIADITDDAHGSVPCNLGDASIADPVYGVDIHTGKKTEPYKENVVDVMAVGNLPNELPRDASRYFGEQLIKYVIPQLQLPGSRLLEAACILKKGKLTAPFSYMQEYATATSA